MPNSTNTAYCLDRESSGSFLAEEIQLLGDREGLLPGATLKWHVITPQLARSLFGRMKSETTNQRNTDQIKLSRETSHMVAVKVIPSTPRWREK
jgi:hypothetical protein